MNGQPRVERNIRAGFRVTGEEREEIAVQAEISRLTISEYARRRIFSRRIIPGADLAVLGELRRLVGLMKHVHLETGGVYSELTANAIRALEACARALERRHNENRERRERNGGPGPP
jgi:hypothetical protein